MNIEAKGENEDSEEVNVNLYEMVKKCVISGKEKPEAVKELLDLNANLVSEKLLSTKRTRAYSMI